MSANLRTWFGGLGWGARILILAAAAALVMNGVVGTVAWVDGWIAHKRDRTADAKIEASDRRIEALEAEKSELELAAETDLKEVVRLKIEIQAKDQLIEQASERIKQSDRKIEEIIRDFEAETDRINSLSPDAVDAELRRRLKEAGRRKD